MSRLKLKETCIWAQIVIEGLGNNLLGSFVWPMKVVEVLSPHGLKCGPVWNILNSIGCPVCNGFLWTRKLRTRTHVRRRSKWNNVRVRSFCEADRDMCCYRVEILPVKVFKRMPYWVAILISGNSLKMTHVHFPPRDGNGCAWSGSGHLRVRKKTQPLRARAPVSPC